MQSPLFTHAADRIEELDAQLDSTLKDRARILAERDKTFARMLNRAEDAEAKLAKALDSLDHEVKRSRRHLAGSTLSTIAELKGGEE